MTAERANRGAPAGDAPATELCEAPTPEAERLEALLAFVPEPPTAGAPPSDRPSRSPEGSQPHAAVELPPSPTSPSAHDAALARTIEDAAPSTARTPHDAPPPQPASTPPTTAASSTPHTPHEAPHDAPTPHPASPPPTTAHAPTAPASTPHTAHDATSRLAAHTTAHSAPSTAPARTAHPAHDANPARTAHPAHDVNPALAADPTPTPSAAPEMSSPFGVRSAELVGLADGVARIRFRGDLRVVEVPVDGDVEMDLLEDARRDRQRVLVETFPGGQLVVGVLQVRRPRELKLRAEVLELDATESITLRSGRAGMRMRNDGDIEVVGSRISAMSRGLMRLVGRALRLN